jgi:hypothetical protein
MGSQASGVRMRETIPPGAIVLWPGGRCSDPDLVFATVVRPGTPVEFRVGEHVPDSLKPDFPFEHLNQVHVEPGPAHLKSSGEFHCQRPTVHGSAEFRRSGGN